MLYCNKIQLLQSSHSRSFKALFNVEGLRHPLIEQLQTNELYVTNDLSLGEDKDGLLLYGTNAVGKTSFMTVGKLLWLKQVYMYLVVVFLTSRMTRYLLGFLVMNLFKDCLHLLLKCLSYELFNFLMKTALLEMSFVQALKVIQQEVFLQQV